MEKIAIKYSADNWANIKVAVDLLREHGCKVKKRKNDYIDEDTKYLENYNELYRFRYANYPDDESLVLSMPEDMDKLKEALGIEVTAESIEVPKDGEVWVWDYKDCSSFTGRIYSSSDGDRFYSLIHCGGGFVDSNGSCDYGLEEGSDFLNKRKATPEEITKLIEAEHSNGWHWDVLAKKFISIPVFKEGDFIKLGGELSSMEARKIGSDKLVQIKEINKNKGEYQENWFIIVNGHPGGVHFREVEKVVSREAYETQNMVRLMNEKAHKAIAKINKDYEDKCHEYILNAKITTETMLNGTIKVIINDDLSSLTDLKVSMKKPLKRIILNQYEAIEILVDEFEMVHKDGKFIFTPKDKTESDPIKDIRELFNHQIEKVKLITENEKLKEDIRVLKGGF